MYNRAMLSRSLRAGLFIVVAVLAMPVLAHAQYESPNYEINEVFIGTGGELDSCGTAFCADQTVGGTAVGNVSSNNFGAEGGFGDPSEATLEVGISNNVIDLGVLNTSTTSAASANFSVKSYLTAGYIVKIYGNSPTNFTGPGTTSLTALNSPSLSVPGTEQFGINLVANATPGIGANPSQAPDATFSFGEAAAGYNTPDYFKFVDGDTIALSDTSTGETDYTVSIIANISNSTPGGQYKTILVVQVIATF